MHVLYGKRLMHVAYGRRAFVYGIPSEKKPVRNIPPEAKLRFRFRNNAFAELFVKTPIGITSGHIQVVGDEWELVPTRENIRI